jgi:hypothetical protein
MHLSPSHRYGCFSPDVAVPDPANRTFRSATASTADQGSSFNLFSTDMAQPQARQYAAIALRVKHVPRIYCSRETS